MTSLQEKVVRDTRLLLNQRWEKRTISESAATAIQKIIQYRTAGGEEGTETEDEELLYWQLRDLKCFIQSAFCSVWTPFCQ